MPCGVFVYVLLCEIPYASQLLLCIFPERETQYSPSDGVERRAGLCWGAFRIALRHCHGGSGSVSCHNPLLWVLAFFCAAASSESLGAW